MTKSKQQRVNRSKNVSTNNGAASSQSKRRGKRMLSSPSIVFPFVTIGASIMGGWITTSTTVFNEADDISSPLFQKPKRMPMHTTQSENQGEYFNLMDNETSTSTPHQPRIYKDSFHSESDTTSKSNHNLNRRGRQKKPSRPEVVMLDYTNFSSTGNTKPKVTRYERI